MNKGLVIFFYVVLASASGGCYSQPQDAKEQNTATASTEVNVSAVKQFSKSLAAKDREEFVRLIEHDGLQIYRGFASGNLGGRGASLAKTFTAKDITHDLTIGIEGQTPLDFPWLFPELVAQAGADLTTYPFSAGLVDVQNPSKTLANLQELLAAKSELVEGTPLLLSGGVHQVVVEAQSIDGMLVGGFAFFEGSRLVAIWDVR